MPTYGRYKQECNNKIKIFINKAEVIISSFRINLSKKLASLLRRLIYIKCLPIIGHKL